MKTFNKVITKPKLEIHHDAFPENPRTSYSNIGWYIRVSSSYASPDDIPELIGYVSELAKYANNAKDHCDKIIMCQTPAFPTKEKDFIYAFPVSVYIHGNSSFSLIEDYNNPRGFDNSNDGIYIVSKEQCVNLGIDYHDKQLVLDTIKKELETYEKYVNGEVYRFVLYDDKGEVEDDMSGFCNLDDIKSELPDDWKDEDMEEYLVNN